MNAFTPLPLHGLWDALANLQGETDGAIAVVRLEFNDHAAVDVFRVTQLRERPRVYRVRGFVDTDDKAPVEFAGLLLATVDGRGYLTGRDNTEAGFGHLVIAAKATTRAISELAEFVAARIRKRFES